MRSDDYIIKRPEEECSCANCGSPLYVGDKVVPYDEVPYCSVGCARVGIDKPNAKSF